ncbi:hypothetical protein DMO16_22495 [Fictibacillus sp. S7]|nr:hypothetical protein DMO16_22495 [Fictibacillus sp. S7]
MRSRLRNWKPRTNNTRVRGTFISNGAKKRRKDQQKKKLVFNGQMLIQLIQKLVGSIVDVNMC